jgi:hypothetical protein
MSRQSFRSVLKLAITMIGLATMTHTASAGPHKDGCAARDIQMLGIVARWRLTRLQHAFRQLSHSPEPFPYPLSETARLALPGSRERKGATS